VGAKASAAVKLFLFASFFLWLSHPRWQIVNHILRKETFSLPFNLPDSQEDHDDWSLIGLAEKTTITKLKQSAHISPFRAQFSIFKKNPLVPSASFRIFVSNPPRKLPQSRKVGQGCPR
jgi:hypothetical protein